MLTGTRLREPSALDGAGEVVLEGADSVTEGIVWPALVREVGVGCDAVVVLPSAVDIELWSCQLSKR